MTDITDQDRRAARAWAKNWQGDQDDDTSAAARVILATVEAPASSLAEELREQASWAEEIGGPVHGSKFRALADRAEQIEQERNTLEQQRDYWCDSERQAAKDRDHLAAEIDKANTDILHLTAERDEAKKERDHFFREVENVRNWKEQLLDERDEAHAEVERLKRDLAEEYKTSDARDYEVDRLRAEAERLTAERDAMSAINDHYDHYAVQKGAESNAESIDPADVRPGEPWLIRVRGRDAVAIRDGHEEWPWSVAFIHGESDEAKDDVVTLVSRLVPAPRVITNPDELERLAEGSIVRDRAGHAWERCPDEDWYSTEELDDGFSSRRLADYAGPVTVLWEPGA